MAEGDLLVDRLVAWGLPAPCGAASRLAAASPGPLLLEGMGLSGLLVEPLAWLQSWLWARPLRKAELPDDPIVVIGHWRSGTTYLHQLLACDSTLATARNSLTTRRMWPCCSNPGFAGHSKRG